MSILDYICDRCGDYGSHFPGNGMALCNVCYPEWQNQWKPLMSPFPAKSPKHNTTTTLSADSKKDAGKPMAATPYEYFPRAILAVAQVATDGVPEYGRNTWASLPDGHLRRCDAFHRHLLAHATGEKIDKKSGLPHLAHALWNLMSMVEWDAREVEEKA